MAVFGKKRNGQKKCPNPHGQKIVSLWFSRYIYMYISYFLYLSLSIYIEINIDMDIDTDIIMTVMHTQYVWL